MSREGHGAPEDATPLMPPAEPWGVDPLGATPLTPGLDLAYTPETPGAEPAAPLAPEALVYAEPAPSHLDVGELTCPKCGDPTRSLKRYAMMRYLVFLWLFAYWDRKEETACPRCMRKTLALSALLNLVPANLLWFVLLVPWYSIQLGRTYVEGHSASVLATYVE